MRRRNKSIEDSTDKKLGKLLWKSQQKKCNFVHESTVVTLPLIVPFAVPLEKIIMVKHPAPPQKSVYSRLNFHVNSSLISLEKTKAVSKVKD